MKILIALFLIIAGGLIGFLYYLTYHVGYLLVIQDEKDESEE
jgi:hypothetical protein